MIRRELLGTLLLNFKVHEIDWKKMCWIRVRGIGGLYPLHVGVSFSTCNMVEPSYQTRTVNSKRKWLWVTPYAVQFRLCSELYWGGRLLEPTSPASHIEVPKLDSWLHSFIPDFSFLIPWEATDGGTGPCQSSGLPALAWPITSCCEHLRSEPVDGKVPSIYLFFPSFLSLFLLFK